MAKSCVIDEHLLFSKADEVFESMEYQKKRRVFNALDSFSGTFSNKGLVPSLNQNDTRVKIYWDNICDSTVVACDTSCTPAGTSTDGIDCQEYTMTQCAQIDFSISTGDFEGLEGFKMLNETLADEIIRGEASLIESHVIPYLLNTIDASAGENKFTLDTTKTVTPTETTIPATQWNSQLLGYFRQVEDFNKYSNPRILSGSYALQSDVINKEMGYGLDVENKGYQALGMNFDVVNIAKVLATTDTYMLDANRWRFASKHEYKNSAPSIAYPDGAAWSTWSIPSRFIPNLRIDMAHKIECESEKNIRHYFRMRINYDMFEAPADLCDGTASVLKFVCA